MADPQKPPIRLQLDLSADQPGLLEGLDSWLRLGLLTEAQVLALAQTQLACEVPPFPSAVMAAEPAGTSTVEPSALDVPASGGTDPSETAGSSDFLPPDSKEEEAIFRTLPPPPSPSRQRGQPQKGQPQKSQPQRSQPQRGQRQESTPRRASTPRPSAPTSPSTRPPQSPSATGVWLDRLMSELSVVWLLGLGVFLVVLSSAVLAATQWARFNAVGQYLVLLAYTLVFWGVGLSCRRRENLQLTAQTLGMIALLLVPLNFWALDVLGVLASAGGMLLGAVAVLLLSGVTVQGLRQQRGLALEQGNALGLAYLHMGWSAVTVPIWAVYLGVLLSAGVILYRSLQLSSAGRQRPPRRAASLSAGDQGQGTSTATTAQARLHLPTVTLGTSLGLLLLRALTVTEPTQWGQFGLAFGLYAATWVWLGQRHFLPSPLPDSRLPPPPSPLPTPASPSLPSPLSRWPILLGRLLLVGSWLMTITDWLAQAFGISSLGLGLRLQALQSLGKRRDLLVAYGLVVQLGFLGWELLPSALQQGMMNPLLAWMDATSWPRSLLGLSLFPYVVGLVALGDRYYRRQQPKLGRFSDELALITNVLLTLISTTIERVLVVNLMASTVTAFILTGRRTPRRQGYILLSYGLTVTTILVTIDQRWPQFSLAHWAAVGTALAVAALLLSKALPKLWGKSAWLYGLGLSAFTYLLLWWHLLTIPTSWQSPWSLLGLAIPVAFTLICRHTASVPTTALALLFTLGMPWTRLVGLATAMVLSATNSVALRQPSLPFVTVAYGLGLVVATVEQTIPTFPRHWTDWYSITTALVCLIWAIWRSLAAFSAPHPAQPHSRTPQANPTPNPQPLLPLYRIACDQWGHLLTLGLLTVMTIFPRWLLLAWESPRIMPILALAGLLLGLILRYWGHVQPRTVYLAGWAVQLLVAEAMAWRWGTPLALALPTLGLGALSLALATGLSRTRPHLVPPLQHLTLAYAGLALVLRSYTATAWTGWLVVGAALLVLEIGRRGQQPLTRWMALVGLSVGWYELVVYQMLQAPGGAVADGLIVLATVAVLIMGVYRLVAGRLRAEWGLPQEELLWAAHLHWGVGSLLMLGAGLSMANSAASFAWVGVGVAAVFVGYAASQGRLGTQDDLKSAWVYGALVELVGWFVLVRLAAPGLAWLDDWWGVVACGVAVPIYWIPWETWNWPQRPWRVMAILVPLLITLMTQGIGHIPTLWVFVGFYGWLAWHSGRVRVSYLSVAAAVWAVWLWLAQRAIQDTLLWMLPLGLAMLYVAQIDPDLRQERAKTLRHWLRVTAVGIVLFPALVANRWTGWPVGAMSLGLLAVGLTLRIRAFLYVGTLVFGLNALNQLVLLNTAYPFFKWIIGIAVGVVLIWVAADFERRRSQWLQITQTWLDNLEGWQ